MKTEKDKMIAGELYNPLNETLIENRRHARNLTYMYNQTLDEEKTKRHQLLTELFGSLGSQIEVEPHFHCDYGYNIHVGENFYANFNCVILDFVTSNLAGTVCWVLRCKFIQQHIL